MRLIGQVISVSVETVEIVAGLPGLGIAEEEAEGIGALQDSAKAGSGYDS